MSDKSKINIKKYALYAIGAIIFVSAWMLLIGNVSNTVEQAPRNAIIAADTNWLNNYLTGQNITDYQIESITTSHQLFNFNTWTTTAIYKDNNKSSTHTTIITNYASFSDVIVVTNVTIDNIQVV